LDIGGVSASFTSTTAAEPSGSSSGGGGSLEPVLIALLSAAGLVRLEEALLKGLAVQRRAERRPLRRS
jgi:hypothetical protein